MSSIAVCSVSLLVGRSNKSLHSLVRSSSEPKACVPDSSGCLWHVVSALSEQFLKDALMQKKKKDSVYSRENWWFTPVRNVYLLVWVKACMCSCFRRRMTARSRKLREGKRRKPTIWRRRTRRRTEYRNKGENLGGVAELLSPAANVELVWVSERKLNGSWAAEPAALKPPTWSPGSKPFPSSPN